MRKVKIILIMLFGTALLTALSVCTFSLVEYYDLMSVLVVGALFILVGRFTDILMRDSITQERHLQTLVSTFVTTILILGAFIGGYYIYTMVLNNLDIFKYVIETFNITALSDFVK